MTLSTWGRSRRASMSAAVRPRVDITLRWNISVSRQYWSAETRISRGEASTPAKNPAPRATMEKMATKRERLWRMARKMDLR